MRWASWAVFAAGVSAAPSLVRRVNFDYNDQKIQGVNLGGWFVLEPWINAGFFNLHGNPPDEYTMSQQLGAQAQNILSQHWNTWYTKQDFVDIKNAGLNHVRVPIGYWAVNPMPGDPYVQGQLSVLDQAVEWCRELGLRMMLDLHGAPGSQNGFDNSGRKSAVGWQRVDPSGTVTLRAIELLSRHYAGSLDVVTAIELLNEPLGTTGVLDMGKVKQFYEQGYNVVRAAAADTMVVLHDAFEPLSYWQGFMSPTSHQYNVMMDTHIYQVFDDSQLRLSTEGHVQAACSQAQNLDGEDKWTVVGEWTGAMTDCAQFLNGQGMGSRYDNTFGGGGYIASCTGFQKGSSSQLSADAKQATRRFIEAQLDSYSTRSGWIFWCWKTEQGAPGWDMKDLIANGLFPQPLSARQYPGQCS